MTVQQEFQYVPRWCRASTSTMYLLQRNQEASASLYNASTDTNDNKHLKNSIPCKSKCQTPFFKDIVSFFWGSLFEPTALPGRWTFPVAGAPAILVDDPDCISFSNISIQFLLMKWKCESCGHIAKLGNHGKSTEKKGPTMNRLAFSNFILSINNSLMFYVHMVETGAQGQSFR